MNSLPQGNVGETLPDERIPEFVELFKKQVALPAEKTPHPFILCTVGLVGAGKSTVMKQLAPRLNLVRVPTDDVRGILKEHGFNYQKAHAIAMAFDEWLVKEGYGIAADGNCGSPKGREVIHEIVSRTHLSVAWIHVNPPEEFIINKLKNFKHTWLFKDGDHAVSEYLRNKEFNKDLLKPNYPFLYTFDTSRADLQAQVDEAARIIEKVVAEGNIPAWS